MRSAPCSDRFASCLLLVSALAFLPACESTTRLDTSAVRPTWTQELTDAVPHYLQDLRELQARAETAAAAATGEQQQGLNRFLQHVTVIENKGDEVKERLLLPPEDPVAACREILAVRDADRRKADLGPERLRGEARQTWREWRRQEQALWDKYLTPKLLLAHGQDLTKRRELLTIKYFHDEDDRSGNFIEGYLNSRLSFTRFDPTTVKEDTWLRKEGVSRMEAVARLEPVLVFDGNDQHGGVMGTLGLTYHLFPDFEVDATDKFSVTRIDDFWSEWVQRVGFRVGIGAQDRPSESVDTIFGAGLQVNSFMVWAVYSPEEEEVLLGIGLGDFRALKSVLPAFN